MSAATTPTYQAKDQGVRAVAKEIFHQLPEISGVCYARTRALAPVAAAAAGRREISSQEAVR